MVPKVSTRGEVRLISSLRGTDEPHLPTRDKLRGWSPNILIRFVMGSLQWNRIYKLGEDELHRPPVVAPGRDPSNILKSNCLPP